MNITPGLMFKGLNVTPGTMFNYAKNVRAICL